MKVWYCKSFLSCLNLVKLVGENVSRWFGGSQQVVIDLNKSISLRQFFEQLMKAIPVQ